MYPNMIITTAFINNDMNSLLNITQDLFRQSKLFFLVFFQWRHLKLVSRCCNILQTSLHKVRIFKTKICWLDHTHFQMMYQGTLYTFSHYSFNVHTYINIIFNYWNILVWVPQAIKLIFSRALPSSRPQWSTKSCFTLKNIYKQFY